MNSIGTPSLSKPLPAGIAWVTTKWKPKLLKPSHNGSPPQVTSNPPITSIPKVSFCDVPHQDQKQDQGSVYSGSVSCDNHGRANVLSWVACELMLWLWLVTLGLKTSVRHGIQVFLRLICLGADSLPLEGPVSGCNTDIAKPSWPPSCQAGTQAVMQCQAYLRSLCGLKDIRCPLGDVLQRVAHNILVAWTTGNVQSMQQEQLSVEGWPSWT